MSVYGDHATGPIRAHADLVTFSQRDQLAGLLGYSAYTSSSSC